MPYYQKLGEMPRKHHIWFHRNGAAPTLQERRHRLRARHYDGRFQRSLLDHVSSAAAHARAQRQAVQVRRAEESDR